MFVFLGKKWVGEGLQWGWLMIHKLIWRSNILLWFVYWTSPKTSHMKWILFSLSISPWQLLSLIHHSPISIRPRLFSYSLSFLFISSLSSSSSFSFSLPTSSLPISSFFHSSFFLHRPHHRHHHHHHRMTPWSTRMQRRWMSAWWPCIPPFLPFALSASLLHSPKHNYPNTDSFVLSLSLSLCISRICPIAHTQIFSFNLILLHWNPLILSSSYFLIHFLL